MQCIMPQSLTTPDKLLSNPLHGKGFCEPQQYRCALERCNNGYDSLNLNIEILNGLTEILKTFDESISKWCEQSQKKINNSKESSTTKQALRECISAAKKYAERNTAVTKEIEEKATKNLTTFRSKYGKSLIGVQKTKEFETKFKRHQNTWLETLENINEHFRTYREAVRKLDIAREREEATKRDVSSTDDGKRKASQEVERRQKKLDSYKRKYRSSIDDITTKQNRYETDMFAVLKETDDFEKQRLEQVQASFHALKTAFLIETETYRDSMSEAFDKAIQLQKIDKDLEYFDTTYGSKTKAKTKWPVFEEIND